MDDLIEATAAVEDAHFWHQGLRRFARPLLEAATAGLDGPRLLDCGCGTGANLPLLAEYGRAAGFDLAEAGLGRARARGAGCVRADATAAPFETGRLDVVTAFDVLYCLPDEAERAALREVYRLLKPGGAFIVNVAALDLLRGRHSVLAREIRRYTTHGLGHRLAAAGLRIERITYTNVTLLPLMLAVRLGQRVRGLGHAPGRGDLGLPPPVVNRALSTLLALESRALRWTNLPLGSSVLCLARKG